MVEGYDFAVWGTQGGGLVRWNAESRRYVFVTTPNCPGLNVGDEMPEEWDVIAANREARRASEEALDFQIGLSEFYDVLFAKIDDGSVTLNQAERFFPKDVRSSH
ncbi:MAG: hypothetical protein AAB472_02880 [Patescibacteria group bacterium]